MIQGVFEEIVVQIHFDTVMQSLDKPSLLHDRLWNAVELADALLQHTTTTAASFAVGIMLDDALDILVFEKNGTRSAQLCQSSSGEGDFEDFAV